MRRLLKSGTRLLTLAPALMFLLSQPTITDQQQSSTYSKPDTDLETVISDNELSLQQVINEYGDESIGEYVADILNAGFRIGYDEGEISPHLIARLYDNNVPVEDISDILFSPPHITFNRVSLAPYSDYEEGVDHKDYGVEKLPDVYQKVLLDNNGGFHLFVKGRITDLPDLKDLRGKKDEYGGLYDNAIGLFDQEINQSYTRVDKGNPENTTLHEDGHGVDFIFGPIYYGEPISSRFEFQPIFEACRTTLGEHAAKSTKEFFAEGFAKYYNSPADRFYIWRECKELHTFMGTIEEDVYNFARRDFE